jgi:two-component system, chemotaxis family, sensor kinase CheA
LIVQVGSHRFALPQVSVVEADAAHHLEHVQGAKVLRLRQEVLPVADLCELFGLVDEAKESDFPASSWSCGWARCRSGFS